MLISIFTITFLLSTFLVIYVYLIYPVVVLIIGHISSRKPGKILPAQLPQIAIIIPAHNEVTVIQEKINNHLALDYPDDKFKLVVIADSCSDDTANKARESLSTVDGQHTVYEVSGGKGKTNALNEIVPSIATDIYVFADANVLLGKSALKNIAATLNNQHVGCVAGQLSYYNSDSTDAAATNGLYWRYEEFIKKSESRSGSVMGADGSIFAIRAHLFQRLPVDVLDDFCTSIGVVIKGYELTYDDSIKAYEKASEEWSEEFARKVRIANRSFTSYRFLRPNILRTFSGLNLWKFYSHKVLRWYSIFFMALAYLSHAAIMYLNANFITALTFFLHTVFYLLPVLNAFGGSTLPAPINNLARTIRYFLMANIATAIGIVKSLNGKKITSWEKAKSTRT